VPYTQTVIDNFNDNSINTSIWNQLGTTGITEVSGSLRIPSVAAYPQIQSTANRNLTTGILAAKISRSGTVGTTDDTEFYFGVHDGTRYVQAVFFPAGNTFIFREYGGSTVTSPVITDTSGLNSSWTNGTWIGMGMNASDNVLRLYKSPDGQTWTEMGRVTVGGGFVKTAAGLYFMGGYWGSSSITFAATADDASYWAFTAGTTTNKMKVRVGNAWVAATPKVRVGGVWVTARPKARVGGAWVSPKQ
jgi:hypothetical protein